MQHLKLDLRGKNWIFFLFFFSFFASFDLDYLTPRPAWQRWAGTRLASQMDFPSSPRHSFTIFF